MVKRVRYQAGPEYCLWTPSSSQQPGTWIGRQWRSWSRRKSHVPERLICSMLRLGCPEPDQLAIAGRRNIVDKELVLHLAERTAIAEAPLADRRRTVMNHQEVEWADLDLQVELWHKPSAHGDPRAGTTGNQQRQADSASKNHEKCQPVAHDAHFQFKSRVTDSLTT